MSLIVCVDKRAVSSFVLTFRGPSGVGKTRLRKLVHNEIRTLAKVTEATSTADVGGNYDTLKLVATPIPWEVEDVVKFVRRVAKDSHVDAQVTSA